MQIIQLADGRLAETFNKGENVLVIFLDSSGSIEAHRSVVDQWAATSALTISEPTVEEIEIEAPYRPDLRALGLGWAETAEEPANPWGW